MGSQPPYIMLQEFIRSQQIVGQRDEVLEEVVVVTVVVGHGGGVNAGTVLPAQIGKHPPYGRPHSLVYVAQACCEQEGVVLMAGTGVIVAVTCRFWLRTMAARANPISSS